MYLHDILRERLLKKAGVIDERPKLIFANLKKSEWSPRFEQLMRNRLIMGAFRYETFVTKHNKFNYDTATEAINRIQKYQKTGNTEHLVDAANMLLLEFEFGCHPNKYFNSIDDGEHAKKKGGH